MNWQKSLKGRLRPGEPLSKHTTFKIGGRAEFFIEPRDSRDLSNLVKLAQRDRIPLRLLGAGSNLLINDKGLRGMVLRLSAPYFKKVSSGKGLLESGAGVLLGELVSFARRRGLSSLEFLVGIPGTLGGALVMNAAAMGGSIGEITEEVTVMDYRGKIKKLPKKNIGFSYRHSSLDKYIVLAAKLKVEKKDKQEVERRIKANLKTRMLSQDYSYPSAGSIFKNPRHDYAGRLIEACGLKGKAINGAIVSRTHANFILNTRKAKARDVLALMDLIKKKVRGKFKVELKPEIKIW